VTVRALTVLAVVLPLAVQGAAHADDVVIEVTMVKAKLTGSSDPSLRRWRSTLRRLAGYRAYRVVDTRQRECDWMRQQEFRLPGGRLLYVTPKGLRGDRVLMRVRLLEGGIEIMKSDVQIGDDGPMFMGLDRDGDADGGALVIMLKAGVQ
jgi:hypothetical protein